MTCELQLAKKIQSNNTWPQGYHLSSWMCVYTKEAACLCEKPNCVCARTADVATVNEPLLSFQLMWPFSTLVVTLWQRVHACCNGSLTRPTGQETSSVCTTAVDLSGCEGQRQVCCKQLCDHSKQGRITASQEIMLTTQPVCLHHIKSIIYCTHTHRVMVHNLCFSQQITFTYSLSSDNLPCILVILVSTHFLKLFVSVCLFVFLKKYTLTRCHMTSLNTWPLKTWNWFNTSHLLFLKKNDLKKEKS